MHSNKVACKKDLTLRCINIKEKEYIWIKVRTGLSFR